MARRLGIRGRVKTLVSRADYFRRRAVRGWWNLASPIAERIGPTVEFDGVRVYVDPRFGKSIAKDLLNGGYEWWERQILKAHLAPTDIVMELGAGIGVISTYCAQRLGSERVFAYEGNPILEHFIRRTYGLNRVSPTIEMCLIGEHDGEQSFWLAEDFWASSTLAQPGAPFAPDRCIKVPVKAFSQEVRRINPSLLIVDIEGGEDEFCRCADFHNVQKILLEMHEWIIGPDAVESIRSRLSDAGFQLKQQIVPHGLFLERTALRQLDSPPR